MDPDIADYARDSISEVAHFLSGQCGRAWFFFKASSPSECTSSLAGVLACMHDGWHIHDDANDRDYKVPGRDSPLVQQACFE